MSAARRTAGRARDWRRRPTDEQYQRAIVRALLLAGGQLVWVDRTKQRAAIAIHNGHDHLRPTRRIEDDPIQSGSAAADPYELADRGRVHRPSLLRKAIPGTASVHPPSAAGGPKTATTAPDPLISRARGADRCNEGWLMRSAPKSPPMSLRTPTTTVGLRLVSARRARSSLPLRRAS